jgi:hypothetical protein
MSVRVRLVRISIDRICYELSPPEVTNLGCLDTALHSVQYNLYYVEIYAILCRFQLKEGVFTQG